MKYELLRNCSHGSKIYTLFVEESKKKYYLKSSSFEEGLKNISQEYEGWKWYSENNKNLKENPTNYEILKENYVRLKILALEGKKISFKDGIKKNYVYFMNVIKHYKEIWILNKNKQFAMHGDLSLENILFRNNEVIFIDWEHYTNSCAYWGFDIYYLLYETLWFNWRSIRNPRNHEILYISKLIKILHSNSPISENNNYKLSHLIGFIEKNKYLWSSQLLNNINKLPLLNFNNADVEYVDKLINNFLEN